MNRVAFLLVTALFVGVGTYALTRALAPAPLAGEAGFDELRWLSREFKLTPAPAAAIADLHAAYQPICEQHCATILDLRAQLAALPDDAPAATRTAVEAALVAATATCANASRDHLRAVAAHMSPAQAARYLALVEPKLTAHDHARPLGLQ